MRRWSFVSGLTLMLLLMLVLSGYCLWVTQGLTRDLDRLIDRNYDRIRAVRELRAAMTRINARFLSSSVMKNAPINLGVFDNESRLIRERLDLIRSQAAEPEEAEQFKRMEVLIKDYLANYGTFFKLSVPDTGRRDQLWDALARGTEDIADHAEAIVQLNEKALFARRDAAVARGRLFGWAALGIAGFSACIYIYTSVRLTQGIFQPLRRLRDAIQQVGMRKFDAIEPLEGGEELTQIATTFNQMAGELRAYIAETDQRSVEASRTSRAILETLPYPIYIVDTEYKVRLMNPRASELSEVLGISGDLPGAVRKCVEDAAQLGCDLIGDDLHRAIEIVLTDATTHRLSTFLPQVFRMTDVPGTIAGWAVLLVDVTRLRQFDQAKTKAISTLGHEVKTPVTTIRMVLHMLLEEKIGPLTTDQRELVAAGRDDCERLLSVLQALLELARFEGGRVEMKLSPEVPADLLMQAEAMHGSYLQHVETPLSVEPVPAALSCVYADAMHVVRVLGNFLSNAAKYRTPGTTVTMRAEERPDGFVRLSVRNFTQRPLSEAEQMHVFDPFYRRPGEGSEGTGLGLAICREIALLHHGRVGVSADLEQVEFYFDLRCVSTPDAVDAENLSSSLLGTV